MGVFYSPNNGETERVGEPAHTQVRAVPCSSASEPHSALSTIALCAVPIAQMHCLFVEIHKNIGEIGS